MLSDNEFEMMNIRFHYLLFTAIFLLTLTSLIGQTADVTVGCVPLRVNFTSPEGAGSFFWDFGDGATSTAQNPTNVYTEPGTYEVEFRPMQGGAVIGTLTITVGPRTTLSIDATPASGCASLDAPLDVIFRNTTQLPEGVSVTNAQWVFDDGTQAIGEMVNQSYTEAGSYTVALALTTTAPSCDATSQFIDEVQVSNGPAVRFITMPNPAANCDAPFTVSFSNQTPGSNNLSFEWDFGNGNTSTDVNPTPQTYTEDGDFTVTLSATDNTLNCTTTFSQTVSIGSPTAAFEVVAPACTNNPVQFQNNSSAGNYLWNFVGLTSSTEANPAINFPAPGEYEVQLTVSSPAGCSTETTQTIVVDGVDASFTAVPDYGCSEPFAVTFTPGTLRDDASYEWRFGDDSTSTTPSLVYDYFADNESPFDENGEFRFNPTLVVTTDAGCIDSATTEVILDIPLARFMPDTVSGCAPLTVEFSDSSRSTENITNWQWIYDNGDTNNFDTADPHNYTFNDPGEYDVVLVITNSLGCQDTSYSIRVEVGNRISPDFSVDNTAICPGDTVQFTDITGSDLIDEWRYVTDNDRSSHCFNEANPQIPFATETGTFGVTMIVGYNGCLDSINRADLITVSGPIADIGYTIPCDTNIVTFANNSSDATSISWDFGDGTTSMEDAPAHAYETGDFQVILTAENSASGCPASQDTANIKIRNLTSLGMVAFQQCRNQPVNLDATMSADVDTSCFRGYTWHFNHPSLRPLTISEPTNMEISYPDTGFYTIELVVEDVNGCVDTSSYPIRVDEAIADFEMDKSVICFPMNVNFTDRSTSTAGNIEQYMWDFGDGVGMSQEQNPIYGFPINPGGNSITVTLSVVDEVGCPGETSMSIETYTPVSRISTDPVVPNICAGETVNFSATDFTERGSNLDFTWNLGNGTQANTQNASATYTEGGAFNVILNFTEVATGCPGQSTAVVNVQDFPIASFASDVDDVSPLCHPQNITFTNTSTTTSDLTSIWDFGNGQTGFGNQSASFFDKGVFTVTLNTQTSFGCADETSREFNLLGPEGEINVAFGPFCEGDEVSASALNLIDVANFSWVFQGEQFGENTENVTFTIDEVPPNGQEPLTLELVGAEGCTTAVEGIIAVTPVMASFASDANPCSLDVAFSNQSTGATNFSWDFGDGSTEGTRSPSHTYAAEGTYTVTLLAQDVASGCMSETTQTITVSNPTPVVASSLDTCIMIGSTIELPIINNSNSALLLFSNQIGITCPTGEPVANCPTPVVNASNADLNFSLTVQDECFPSQTLDYTIGVFDPNSSMVPNAFTPDGDGTNDFFNVVLSDSGCSEVSEILSFRIFDRWGEQVYNNDTPSQGWNGEYNGTRQNPDVYIYAIEVRLNNGAETTLTGDVTLIR